jgi:hypothetical protein
MEHPVVVAAMNPTVTFVWGVITGIAMQVAVTYAVVLRSQIRRRKERTKQP